MTSRATDDSQTGVDVLARIVVTVALTLLAVRMVGVDYVSWSPLETGIAAIIGLTLLLVLIGRQLGFWVSFLIGLAQLIDVVAEPLPLREFYRAPLLTWPLMLVVASILLLWLHRERRTYVVQYERHPQF